MRPTITFSTAPLALPDALPLMDAATLSILRELGYTYEQIAQITSSAARRK